MALYRAKAEGRGTAHFFEPEMDRRIQARRLLELDLRKAFANGEFELYYQPLISLNTNAVSGFEALLRWRHPERGMIAPGEFIPLAEEIGLIVPLGEWVLRTACTEAMRWPGELKVAVNLSPAQFRSRGVVKAVVTALAYSRLPANRLELEITESVLLGETEANLATLHQLARARRAHLDGRFRHRLFEPELSALLSVRQDQDRSLVRQRTLRASGLRRHHPRRCRLGAEPRHRHDGGGH